MRKVIIVLVILSAFGLKGFSQSFSLDSSFSPNFNIRTHFNVSINSIVELSSNNLIISGNFSFSIPGKSYNNIVRLNNQGILNINFSDKNGGGDLIFVNNNLLANGQGSYGFIDTNGNEFNRARNLNYLKTIGCSTGKDYFYSNGSCIAPNGFSQTANGPCPIINPPDTFPGRHLVKVTPQGLWDSTFAAFPNEAPEGVIRYDSNRLLVYGVPFRFSHYNGVRVNGLCRIFNDGSLDTTFTANLSDTLAINFLKPVILDGSGKIMLIGKFLIHPYANQYNTILRLNSDGSIDSTFTVNNGPTSATYTNYLVFTLEQTEDNGYLVGGIFHNYQGHAKNNIAKIDSTGILEPQYFTGLGPDSAYNNGVAGVSVIKKSKLGGYYVGGSFLKWDGQPSQPIVRIHGLQTTVGVAETGLRAESRSEVLVYPNPSNGIFTVESEVGIEGVEIYNLSGASTNFNFIVPQNRNAQPDKLNQRTNSSSFDLQNSNQQLNPTSYDVQNSNQQLNPTSFDIQSSNQQINSSSFVRLSFDQRENGRSPGKRTIDLSNLKNGIYFLKIHFENGEVVTKKVVKQ